MNILPIDKEQFIAPLSKVKPEVIELLHKKTVAAILIIAITYLSGIILFTVLLLLKTDYFYIAVFFPLLGYLWLISFGARHVNNHYGFKRTSEGTLVYVKKRQSYSTLITIHIFISLISLIVRLIYEIRNLLLINQELHK